ncbi:YggS family pyridoxal phosphate-dependent enzyme [Candidatus Woesearchaeota archaeon]|nr:YggS family pyridoxal phosphate-dependent enzyme [Candidatus Woesearchaeota archaeon]
MIRENLENLELGNAKLVAVTKTLSKETILEAIECGVTDIGENYVQEAEKKFVAIGKKVRWHFIGHLQLNKVKRAVKIFDLIQTVDSFELAKKISAEAKKIGKTQEILIQLDSSGDKFGIKPEEVHNFLTQIDGLPYINVRGLMTIAPLEKPQPAFKRIKQIFDKEKLSILSMGMSNDYKIAIGEGSTMVRIGTAIFGKRS